jgi:tRNA (guanine37-N1)-methyltransferase
MRLSDYLKEMGMNQPIGNSFDIIGDIIIINFPEKFGKQKQVALALMKIHKNVKTVCKKIGRIEGEERIPHTRKILGNGTETVHRENGFSFKLDVKKVFFTPRMQNERARVLVQIKEGERVLDMFSGVGPFSIPAAKKAEVCSIDLNPYAVKYLKKNAEMNKVKLTPFEGNCRIVVRKHRLKGFDRVIMNFPSKAKDYLDVALASVKKGGTVHFYTFEKDDRAKFGNEVKVISRNPCGDIAPGVFRVCYDLVKK